MAKKYREITLTRHRTITEEAVLDISEEDLHGLTEAELEALANKADCWYSVDDYRGPVLSKDTTDEDDFANGLYDISDDGEEV